MLTRHSINAQQQKTSLRSHLETIKMETITRTLLAPSIVILGPLRMKIHDIPKRRATLMISQMESNGNSKLLQADKSHQVSLVTKAWAWEIVTYKKKLRLSNRVPDLAAANQIMGDNRTMEVNQTIQMQRLTHHLAMVVKVSSEVAVPIMIWIVIISSQRSRINSHKIQKTTHGKNQRRLPSNYTTIISSRRRRRHLGKMIQADTITTNTRGTIISLELTTSSNSITKTAINRGNRDQQPVLVHSHQ